MAMTTTKFQPLWRVLTILARVDMVAGVAIAAALFAWLAWQ
jgi:hypothetical protein